jgi:hypothetical protein
MMPFLFITHGHYSTPLLFYSALPPHFRITSVGVSRPGKGLTSRASAMHSYVL